MPLMWRSVNAISISLLPTKRPADLASAIRPMTLVPAGTITLPLASGSAASSDAVKSHPCPASPNRRSRPGASSVDCRPERRPSARCTRAVAEAVAAVARAVVRSARWEMRLALPAADMHPRREEAPPTERGLNGRNAWANSLSAICACAKWHFRSKRRESLARASEHEPFRETQSLPEFHLLFAKPTLASGAAQQRLPANSSVQS